MSPVKCVFFDLGGVMYELDVLGAMNRLSNICGKSIEEIRTAVYSEELIVPYESGRISSYDFYDGVMKRLGCRVSFDDFKSIWNSVLVKRKDMFQITHKLRRVLDIVFVSNTNELNAYAMDEELRSITEKIVYSHEVGYLKPDHRIFKKALEISGTDPFNTLYFDDLPHNVYAANELGITAFVFRDVNGLLEVFQSFGIYI